MPYFSLTDVERERLMKLINGQSLAPFQRSVQFNDQCFGNVPVSQMPSTSSFPTSLLYPQSFDAHPAQNMNGMEIIRDLFPTTSSTSKPVRRKQQRRPEESCKATCKVCGHEVVYSPQRTWNLMRHVWIMHKSSKPNRCSLCGYSHIKPYVRKHIESQHKDQTAIILDVKSPELEAEWSGLLDQCFGVTYRKWKHHKEESQSAINNLQRRQYDTSNFISDQNLM